MELHLAGKVAIITGASRGIGRAIAEVLSAEGMRLVVAARSLDLLREFAESCSSEVEVFQADLRDRNAPQMLIQFALDKFGRIDLLVNNAGATKRGDFLKLTEEDWEDGFALKFYSAVRCSREAWTHLSVTKGGIVNIVGVGGRTGGAEFAIGGAVNAAALNLTKVLADRGIKDGVRVNAINPGAIATDRLNIRIKALSDDRSISLEDAAGLMAKELGVDRFGEPAEIAKAVAFLASSASAYCQGAILDIDGGQTRTL
jgi:NAD(P)-dependent dehydrogenase (short-subunit alcohol dehydrogenase family)